jgi:ABC-type sugar transport system ATPase subunit
MATPSPAHQHLEAVLALALNGASLECVAGEIHAVVGENGSGKSTCSALPASP